MNSSNEFIERVNRLNLDLLHLVVIQLPKTNKVYCKYFIENSKLFECFSNPCHPKYRAFRCVPYLSSIRNHFTIKTVDNHGRITYSLNGLYHREGDLTVVIASDGTQFWYKNGELHREGDLPAVIASDGTLFWYKNGELHRDGDLPAIINPNGTQEWLKNGETHRESNPAVIWADGTLDWWENGKKIKSNVINS